MDNYLKPDSALDSIKGDNHHLPFELLTFGLATPDKWDITGTQEFFSLKLAMANLLTKDIASLQQEAQYPLAVGSYTAMAIRAKGSFDHYGAIIIAPPVSKGAELDPGIYFKSDFSAEKLQIMTGIPFLATVDRNITLFPLINTHQGDLTKPSAHHLHLSRWGLQYLERQRTVIHDHDYELVFKGVYPKIQQAPGYVHHHYYNNAEDALARLLSEEMSNFERFSSNRNFHHTHAYLTGPSGEAEASIFTVPIAGGAQNEYAAGVYLLAPSGLRALGEESGLPLAAAHNYHPNALNLQLASLQYTNGFDIIPTGNLKNIRDGIARVQIEDPRFDSEFSMRCQYNLHCERPQRPVLDAMDQFHYRSAEGALHALLNLELELWGRHSFDPEFPVQIYKAGVHTRDRVLAVISQSQPYENGVVELQLNFSQGLSEFMGSTFDDLKRYAEAIDTENVTSNTFIIPIGSVIPDKGTELHNNRIAEVLDILTHSYSLQQHNQQQPTLVIGGVDKPVSKDAPCYVLLEWNTKSEETRNESHKLWLSDLEAGHRFIVDLPTAFFQPPAYDQNLPYLQGASLFDEDRQVTVVNRFYQNDSSADLEPGFYYGYTMSHPVGARLASQHHVAAMVERISNSALHVFYQPAADTKSIATHHPRKLSAEQEERHRRMRH